MILIVRQQDDMRNIASILGLILPSALCVSLVLSLKHELDTTSSGEVAAHLIGGGMFLVAGLMAFSCIPNLICTAVAARRKEPFWNIVASRNRPYLQTDDRRCRERLLYLWACRFPRGRRNRNQFQRHPCMLLPRPNPLCVDIDAPFQRLPAFCSMLRFVLPLVFFWHDLSIPLPR